MVLTEALCRETGRRFGQEYQELCIIALIGEMTPKEQQLLCPLIATNDYSRDLCERGGIERPRSTVPIVNGTPVLPPLLQELTGMFADAQWEFESNDTEYDAENPDRLLSGVWARTDLPWTAFKTLSYTSRIESYLTKRQWTTKEAGLAAGTSREILQKRIGSTMQQVVIEESNAPDSKGRVGLRIFVSTP